MLQGQEALNVHVSSALENLFLITLKSKQSDKFPVPPKVMRRILTIFYWMTLK